MASKRKDRNEEEAAPQSKRVCKHPKRTARGEMVAKNEAERALRSSAQQLARLDKKFGPGQGAKRERERLAGKSS